jgi:hypothetical protein
MHVTGATQAIKALHACDLMFDENAHSNFYETATYKAAAKHMLLMEQYSCTHGDDHGMMAW